MHADPPQGPAAPLLPAPLLEAALVHWPLRPSPDRLAELRRAVEALSTEGAAIDLRLARLVSWIRDAGVTQLGYSNLSAFRRERIPWGATQLGSMLRLVQSDLELVKEAASSGLISLTKALLAPGKVEPDDQLAWIARVIAGAVTRRCPTGIQGDQEDDFRVLVFGEEVEDILLARERARAYLGAHLPAGEVDRYLLDCWRKKRTVASICADARKPRPPPAPTPPWGVLPDPATALLGPWVEPGDPWQALERVDALVAVRNGRIAALGQLCEAVVWERVHLDLGYDTVEQFASEVLGISARTLERYRLLGWTLDVHPEIQEAVSGGLDPDRACFVSRLSETSAEARDWLEVCRSLGARMLQEVEDRVIDQGPRKVLAELRRRIAGAPALARAASNAEHGGPPVPAEAASEPEPTETDGPPIRVAYEDLGRAEAERRVRKTIPHLLVDPDLPEAARWFLDTVPEPGGRGVSGEVKRRDHHTCQNPECGTRGVTVEAHHLWWCSKGGDDRVELQITLCRCCHLRLIHSKKDTSPVTVTVVGDALVWTWPDRVVVVEGVVVPAAPPQRLRGPIPSTRRAHRSTGRP